MKKVIKLISIILIITLLSSYLVSCGILDPIKPEESANNAIVESVVDSRLENIDQFHKDPDNSVVDDAKPNHNDQEEQPENEDL